MRKQQREMDTKLRMKKGEARGTRILYRVKSVLSISFSQKTFKRCFCFYLCKMRTKSNQKERGKGKEKERAREGVERGREMGDWERETERESEREGILFFMERECGLGVWREIIIQPRSQQLKGLAGCRKQVCLAVKQALPAKPWHLPKTHVYHTGIWGWW